ncbi:alpha/beta-gliadin MM1-like [Drosophila innubila]|uniref:alpha/beta-gliadin MM1-like n=1 Tax=Drosophila innubila TaxID=198719 RepID=UPI00148E74FA|nr:alpha/beta-gliadin MM1-like [Drosophila innubila]
MRNSTPKAYQIFARAATENVDEEDPEPQGRIFSIVSASEPARYPLYDSKPIIITPPSQPAYPHPPFYPGYPQQPPVIHPVPYPVHPPHPQTIIKPIEQMQLNDISQLTQLILAQNQAQQLQQIQSIQQVPQIQPIQQLPQIQQIQQLPQFQVQSQSLPVPVIYRPFNSNQEGTFTLADQPDLTADQLVDINEEDQLTLKPQRSPILVRRQKPKKKSKKNKKVRVQQIYVALNPAQQQQLQAEAQPQAQANNMEASI